GQTWRKPLAKHHETLREKRTPRARGKEPHRMPKLCHDPNSDLNRVALDLLERRGNGHLRLAGMQFDATLHFQTVEGIDKGMEHDRVPLNLAAVRHAIKTRRRPPTFAPRTSAPVSLR